MAAITSTLTILASVLGGDLATADGMIYFLTPCCSASGKGSAGSSTGVVCRSCYREVDVKFGWGVMVTDPTAVDQLERELAPIIERFAGPMAERLVNRASDFPGI